MPEENNRDILNILGIDHWILKQSPDSYLTSLKSIKEEVSHCTRCVLGKTRINPVFSKGSLNAKLMIIGEAPDIEEDKQGLLFVGPSGQLLHQMLQSIHISPDDVYITHVIKCHPPKNRTPHKDEIQACASHLQAQIQCIKPRVILGLGEVAGQWLCSHSNTLTQMRKRQHTYGDIATFVTYHPAYLLRNPKDKKLAYEDLRHVLQCLKSIN
jgi:uracil-DNA glycosylase family 4